MSTRSERGIKACRVASEGCRRGRSSSEPGAGLWSREWELYFDHVNKELDSDHRWWTRERRRRIKDAGVGGTALCESIWRIIRTDD